MLRNQHPSQLDGWLPNSGDFASWQHPFAAGKIYIDARIVRDLSAQAIGALKAPQPHEIRGILWGRCGSQPADNDIVVTGVELLATEYSTAARGASDATSRLLVLRMAPEKKGETPLGYFRSDLADDLCVTTQDREFAEQYLPDQNGFVLIIKPFDIGICMAGFFFWRNGLLQTDVCDLEVPFIVPAETRIAIDSNKELTGGPENGTRTSFDQAIPVSAAARESPIEAGAQSSIVRDEIPEIPTARRMLRSRVSVVVLAFMLAGAAVYLAMLLGAFHRTHGRGIEFQVRRISGAELALSWNKNAFALQKGERAKLTITDGRLSHELALDNEQLRAGRILYWASSPDVHFHLEIMHNSPGRNEVMDLSFANGQPHRKQTTQAAAIKVQHRPGAQTSAQGGPEAAKKVLALHPALKAIPAKTLNPAAVSIAKTAIAVVKPAKPLYIPPRAIRQVLPDTGPQGVSNVFDGAQASVQVRIDETGRVLTAHLIKIDAGVEPSIAESSLSAAKQWLFEPATLNGKPLTAEHIIVFSFHSSAP